jgi:beta-glucosidase
MSISGVVTFPWKDKVSAIIADFYGGETMMAAVKNVIYGKVNPSGKLPVTF